uniref:(northern house mosquito) hypothetical protein n=1 Tax=Culex pipiens TaxID=7175 RepID=A0A8D8GJI9_CULPI
MFPLVRIVCALVLIIFELCANQELRSSPVSNSANHPAAAPAQQQREHTSSRSSRGKRRRSSPRTALLVVAVRHQAKHEDEERERTLDGDPSPHRPVKKGGSLNHHTRTAEIVSPGRSQP